MLYESAIMFTLVPQFALPQLTCEFIFLLDRSGSMTTRISQTRTALQIFIKSLPLGCCFNFISFGSTYKMWKEESVPYCEETVLEAESFIKSIEADMGGTEMLKPFEHIYKYSDKNINKKNKEKNENKKYFKQILLLTDGQISNINELINIIRNNKEEARVFTLGVGSGVSTSLVNSVARVGGGVSFFVIKEEELQSTVIKMLKCSKQPSITDININWQLDYYDNTHTHTHTHTHTDTHKKSA
eukprot:GHVR01029049.1.p1 GENE.GHVR01029049.1~~GHVR01029049.1.p1  ORF type:complete len:261 (+),score=134.17 GHVR01029049.1:56-784(+)